jgi:chromosome segregation ATPase
VVVQEFTINELKKKVKAEDTIKNMEKELEEKDRVITEKDKCMLVNDQKISELKAQLQEKLALLKDLDDKFGPDFESTKEQYKIAREENSMLTKRNLELTKTNEGLQKQLTKAEEKILEMEEESIAKYHKTMRDFSDAEQKTNIDSEKLKKDLEYTNALILDLKDQLTQKDLKLETLNQMINSLKARLQQKESDLSLHQKNNGS